MRVKDGNILPLKTRREPEQRLVSYAGALAVLARAECMQVAKALQSGGLSRLEVCRMTGLSVIEVAAAMASLLAEELILVFRHGGGNVYELAHPRLGEVILLAEELCRSCRPPAEAAGVCASGAPAVRAQAG